MESALYKCPLSRAVTGASRRLLRELYPDDDPTKNPLRPPTATDTYVSSCLGALGNLVDCTERQKFALTLLSGYRKRSTADGIFITRADHIAYHLDGFYVSLVGLLDRALHLVNEVFDLGIPARACTMRNVAHDPQVKTTPTYADLKAIDSFVEPYRQRRHRSVHHERYSDGEMRTFELIGIMRKADPHDEFTERSLPFEKQEADIYVKAQRAKLYVVVAAGEALAAKLLTNSEDAFVARYGNAPGVS